MALPESAGHGCLQWLEDHADQFSAGGYACGLLAEAYGPWVGASFGPLAWRDLILGDESQPADPYWLLDVRSMQLGWPLSDVELVEALQWAWMWSERAELQLEAARQSMTYPPAAEGSPHLVAKAFSDLLPVIHELAVFGGLCGAWRRQRARASGP
jgi:hypothetical protein